MLKHFHFTIICCIKRDKWLIDFDVVFFLEVPVTPTHTAFTKPLILTRAIISRKTYHNSNQAGLSF